ncbi:putative RNA-directed DNA polymerase [Helianthus annuus]|nr:putative RNA-directed DNA polymerase [Helianthus annuus]
MKFPALWRKWVGASVKSCRASVLVNGSPTSEFKLQRGLRQGDPLSPFLFILAMEALDVIMTRARERGVFEGVKTPKEGPCISHLCYADDVIFMGVWSETNILNLNRILRCFYLCSGLKVNLNKSSLYGVGVVEEEVELMAKKLGCKEGKLPFGYLGLTIGANMKRAKLWKPVVDKFNKKLSAWKAKCLSFAGRLTLAKAVMGALPNYYLSMYYAPKKVIKSLEAIRRDFVWGRKDGINKIRWIAWNKMVKPRKYGGFGIGELRTANLALLTKWGWKIKENLEALWAKVVRAIHENNRSHKPIPVNSGVPGMWKDIVTSYKELERNGIKMNERLEAKLGDGRKVKFWSDNWAGGTPLKDRYPDLFRIARRKRACIADFAVKVHNETQWNIEWTRPPNSDIEWGQWSGMLNVLNKEGLGSWEDRWGWRTDKWEEFTVATVKEQIAKLKESEQDVQWPHWNSWAPTKVNYFTWRAALGRIAVKQELRKRGVELGNGLCTRCGTSEESVEHLISGCTLSKSVWWNILVWLKLPVNGDLSSCEKIMAYANGLNGSTDWKKTVKMVFQATIWHLWKTRNEKEFRGVSRSGNNVVEDVKTDTFLWMKGRSNFKDLVWERWVDFNVRDIIK